MQLVYTVILIQLEINMSLDFTIGVNGENVFSGNVTHNLTEMAREAGIYEALWRSTGKNASEIVDVLEKGLIELALNPTKYKQFDSPNGWGSWENFLPFVAEVYENCKKYPDGVLECCV